MKKQCRKCRQFYLHEGIFGYCKKFKTQALTTDNCKNIKEVKTRTQKPKKEHSQNINR